MALTLTATQSGTTVELVWETDTGDPASGWQVERRLNPPSIGLDVATLAPDFRFFIDGIDEFSVGDVLEYDVTNFNTSETATATLTVFDSTPAAWTTIADVRTMLGDLEASYTDEQIQTAIEQATARLGSVFCKDVTVDDLTGLPVDPNVRTATTVMASRILVAPSAGVAPVQGGQITSERMGSYSYSVRPGTAPSNAGPWTIDGVIKDLVGGYVCPGYAGIPIQTDIYPYEAPTDIIVEEVSTGI